MIFSAFERMVAMRYLRARRREGFISVIAGFSLMGIALGVATLIIVMAVMNGFRAELVNRIQGLNGNLNVFAVQQGPLQEYGRLADRLAALPEIEAALPSIEAQVLLSSRGTASGAIVRAMRPEDIRQRPTIASKIADGTLDGFAGESIAIGAQMARRLNVKVGDRLTLLSPRSMQGGLGAIPRSRGFAIAAIFDVGMFEYDNNFIFMPLEAAQSFLEFPGQASSLEIFLRDPDRLEQGRAAIAEALQGEGRIHDWQQSNAGYFAALRVQRNVLFLILTLIIMVAGFNIISSMIMLVKDKGSDIAILRTMGATQGMIMRIFLLSGASIGVIGSLLGLALGIGFADNIDAIKQLLERMTGTNLFNAEIYFLSYLPSKIVWQEVAQVIAMALGLAFVFTLYPAWRAARLDPVEALRYE